MTTYKHTPGPWTFTGVEIHSTRVFGHPGTGYFGEEFREPIATVNPKHCESGLEVEANARLIAAAPELLEALKIVIPALEERKAVALDDFEKLKAQVGGLAYEEIEYDILKAATDDLNKAEIALAKASGVTHV